MSQFCSMTCNGKEKPRNIMALVHMFRPGHFKGYTVKLNPLDGVYYFDIRPNMLTENILKDHIKTFDHFLFKELWGLIKREAVVARLNQ